MCIFDGRCKGVQLSTFLDGFFGLFPAANELSCRYFAHVNSAEPTGCCHLVAGRMNRLMSGGNSTERNGAKGGEQKREKNGNMTWETIL